MKIITDDWKVMLICFLGVLVLIPLAVLWFLSLGHIRLMSKWWKFLDEQQNKILYR